MQPVRDDSIYRHLVVFAHPEICGAGPDRRGAYGSRRRVREYRSSPATAANAPTGLRRTASLAQPNCGPRLLLVQSTGVRLYQVSRQPDDALSYPYSYSNEYADHNPNWDGNPDAKSIGYADCDPDADADTCATNPKSYTRSPDPHACPADQYSHADACA